MLKLRKVAVTGNLHSGKSTVCQLLQKHGAFVLSADQIVHELFQNPSVVKSILNHFGTDCLDDEGHLDRKKLFDQVQKEPRLLKKLEDLLHPLVLRIIEDDYLAKNAKEDKKALFVVEVPLLFEVGWEKFFDIILLVTASQTLREKRFLNQGKTLADFNFRNSRQLDPKIAKKRSHEVIVNDGDFNHLEAQVLAIVKKIKPF